MILFILQFERFRRVFHSPQYRTLLSFAEYEDLSSMRLSESIYKQVVIALSFVLIIRYTYIALCYFQFPITE